MYKTIFSCLSFFLLANGLLVGQSNFWTAIPATALSEDHRQDNQGPLPTAFQAYQVDFDRIADYLSQAPMEFTTEARERNFLLEIPMPNGELVPFHISESPMMAERLAERYSSIKSYVGRAADKSAKRIRLVKSFRGISGVISTPEGQIYIDPFIPNQLDQNIVYFTKNDTEVGDSYVAPAKTCGFELDEELMAEINARNTQPSDRADFRSGDDATPVDLRIFRAAIATSGEWTLAHASGQKDQAMDIIVTTVARLNMVFEQEMAFRLELIDQADKVIFTDPATDPYENFDQYNDPIANTGASMLNLNTDVMNFVLGVDNYDFGHIYGICFDVGGIASAGVCSMLNKGSGTTCSNNNPTSWRTISITAHEMGHQLGGPHSFNQCDPDGDAGGASSNGHEPGSGSTILSYGGLCGDNNIVSWQEGRDDYFNIGTLQNLYNFLNNAIPDCGTRIETANTFPEIELPYEDGFYIPIGTPFELEATGEDAEGDEVLYTWEQYNTGPSSPLGSPTGNAPSFRSFYPEESLTRVFPNLNSIIANTSNIREVLPEYSRDLNFRLTARDYNEEASGVSWNEVAFKATAQAGPFRITSPSANFAFLGGALSEVKWNVANTDQAPVNCKTVDILLSRDGGFTFTDTLAQNVYNDGVHFVNFPNENIETATLKIKASENIFFDLSLGSFKISENPQASFALEPNTYYIDHCNPDIAVFELYTAPISGFNETIDLSVLNLPSDVTANFSKTSISPGESVTLTIDLTASPLDELLNFQVVSNAPSFTTTKDLYINVINNDFSLIKTQTPINGKESVGGLPEFTWASTPFADLYDLEVSYDPGFSDLIYGEYGKSNTNFTPPVVFENTSTVYWRVRGTNECGPGEWKYSAFQTVSLTCSKIENADLDFPISKLKGTVVESILFVGETGTIDDINVNRLDLDFAPIQGLDIRLTGPNGETAVLMSDDCFNTSEIRISFDDEAGGPMICPPNNFASFTPKEPLSIFDGKEIGGEWKLRIEITKSGFIPGRLNSWNLETCASFAAKNPTLITNETLPVKIGDARVITKEFLEVTDEDNTSTELTYNLLAIPEHGTLTAYDVALKEGDSFLQDFIYDFAVKYTHNGNDAVEDAFYFTVTDNNGGLWGVTKFSINIDSDNDPVSTFTPAENQITLFPNPANSLVDVRLAQPLQERATLSLFDLSGRQVTTLVLEKGNQQKQIDISDFAEGLYVVQLRSGQELFNKKLIIVR